MTSARLKGVWALGALAVSAVCWFFGTGLHPLWCLTWLAPLPVLYVSPRLRAWPAFGVAFFAFALGGLNLAQYLRQVGALPLIGLAIGGPSLVFAWLVVLHRRFVLRGQLLRAMFVLPVVWIAFEYLSELNSPHSTFGNLAYTQMDCLAVLQSAAIAGIWAISFAVFLLPSAVAAVLAPGTQTQRRPVVIVALLFYAAVLGYGVARLLATPAAPRVTVGLIASDAPQNLFPASASTVRLIAGYAEQIPALASQGAQVIVMPEKLGRITPDDLKTADAILEQTAQVTHVFIVAGFQHMPNLNEARVYSPHGTLVGTYEKHHMLPAFEGDLLPGTTRLLTDQPSGRWGVEICKDMDFPRLSRDYAQDGAALMLVPAWDFVTDGWLHGRMAILRGVEDGFSIARAPKQGILTVTDDQGRVLAERSTSDAPFTTLLASVPVLHERTFYDHTGNWFAEIDLLAAVVLLFSVLVVPADADPRLAVGR
jgi:apolipoprotein N-acyltransferase